MGACDPVLAEGVPDEVGASGEFFVFSLLAAKLPNFVRACWVSSLKLRYFADSLPGDTENNLGADFRYFDQSGTLTGSGRSETVYIEVKSMTVDALQPFRMSVNEWQRALRCHESGGADVYVLAVVTSVTHAPKLERLIVDPIRQVELGAASCEVSEMVYTPQV